MGEVKRRTAKRTYVSPSTTGNGWTVRDNLRTIAWDNAVAAHRADDYYDGYSSDEEWWKANLLGLDES